MRLNKISLICMLLLVLPLIYPYEITGPELKITSFEADIYKNDTVILKDFSIIEGVAYEPKVYQGSTEKYSYSLLDVTGKAIYKKDFSLPFLVFSDPPEIIDAQPVWLQTSFNKNLSKIEIYHNDKKIFEKEVASLICNHNGICDNFENSISCIEDCFSGSEDNYCDGVFDGICDPDCAKSADIDCSCGDGVCSNQEEKSELCPKDCGQKEITLKERIIEKATPFVYPSIIVLALLVLLYFLWFMKKTKAYKEKTEDFFKLNKKEKMKFIGKEIIAPFLLILIGYYVVQYGIVLFTLEDVWYTIFFNFFIYLIIIGFLLILYGIWKMFVSVIPFIAKLVLAKARKK